MENAHQAASDEYRRARAGLLAEERALREAAERVSRLRSALPPGPVLDAGIPLTMASGKPVTLGGLLGERRTLIAYHLVFDEGRPRPRPSSAMWVDGFDPLVPHLAGHTSVAVLAPAAPGRLAEIAEDRNWRHVPLVSTQPGDLTDRLGVRGERDLVPALTSFVLGRDGLLRVHWHETGSGVDPFCAAGALLDLVPGS